MLACSDHARCANGSSTVRSRPHNADQTRKAVAQCSIRCVSTAPSRSLGVRRATLGCHSGRRAAAQLRPHGSLGSAVHRLISTVSAAAAVMSLGAASSAIAVYTIKEPSPRDGTEARALRAAPRSLSLLCVRSCTGQAASSLSPNPLPPSDHLSATAGLTLSLWLARSTLGTDWQSRTIA